MPGRARRPRSGTPSLCCRSITTKHLCRACCHCLVRTSCGASKVAAHNAPGSVFAVAFYTYIVQVSLVSEDAALGQAHAGARGVPGSATALIALLHAPSVLEVRVAANVPGISQGLCMNQLLEDACSCMDGKALGRPGVWDAALQLRGMLNVEQLGGVC